jgi:microcystin-dependent protein
MTAQILAHNIPVLSTPFDASKTNATEPSPSQVANGFVPNVDSVAAEHHNFLHNAHTAWLWLAQQMGLCIPFNPSGLGLSLVATPAGGIVSITNATTGATEFYVARMAMAAGYGDPSLDPTHWALINFNTIATFTDPYSDAGGTADAITATFNSLIYPVLQDGFRLTVDVATPNTTTTPTFQPTMNGSTQTARVIKKRYGGTLIPLAPGDMIGVCTLVYHAGSLTWELINPIRHQVLPGTIIVWAGTSTPNGYLRLPMTATNVSRTAYAALFAAIGTTFGVGDGATTFGLPYLPADYSILQANGNQATQSAGSNISHSHGVNDPGHSHTINGQAGQIGVTPYTALQSQGGTLPYWTYQSDIRGTGISIAAQGGASNLPAGTRFNLCIKY